MSNLEGLSQRLDLVSRVANRISDDKAEYVQRGEQAAEDYWNSRADRHPLTTLRRLLKATTNSKEYLEAKYGFYRNLRKIGDTK